MHKSWQALYQRRASIQTSEVLSSPGFSNMPDIFVSAKYFFLWLFQVYYRRRGGILSRFPLEFCREPSLSWRTQRWLFCMRAFPWGRLLAIGPSHPRHRPPRDSIPSQTPGTGGCLPRTGEQSSSPTPSVTGSFPGLPQRRDSLGRKGLRPEGAARTGSGHPPAPVQRAAQSLTLPSSTPGPQWLPSPLTLLFISVTFLGRLRTALWALVSLLVFPCNALLCLIFKPDHHFLFSLCFNTQGLDSQTRDWLCSTALPYPRPNFPASVVPHASERESEILTDTFPSLTSSASGCLLETPS